MSAKMGRPTENPKTEIIKVRATKDDREKLLYCCKKRNKTQYEIVMNGIDKVYNEIKKWGLPADQSNTNLTLSRRFRLWNIIS